jgi:hypothetical protein
MALHSNEARIILALEALKNDDTLSLRAAAKIFNVSTATLMQLRTGRPARRGTAPNSRRLTDFEEKAIVQYVIDLLSELFRQEFMV